MTTDPDRSESDVTAGLRALSQTYQDLPSSVAERLDRTLAELPDLTAPDTTPQPAPPVRRPWWRKRYTLASASLAVVAFVAGGLLFAVQPWSTSQEAGSSSAQDNGEEKAEPFGSKDKGDSGQEDEPGAKGETDEYTITYSGRDYEVSSLDDAAGRLVEGDAAALPGELKPLSSDKALRDDCLAEYTGLYGGRVELVDFAKYEGEPAMILVIRFESGSGYVAAAGPGCEALEGHMFD